MGMGPEDKEQTTLDRDEMERRNTTDNQARPGWKHLKDGLESGGRMRVTD
jgi:hypothetical protein